MTREIGPGARRRPRPALVLGLAALCAVAAAAALAVYAGGAGNSPKPPGRAAATTPAGARAVAPGAALAPSPVRLPADLGWTDVAGLALPVSASAGPRDTAGGLARGFSHDPPGAVLAAVHILARISPQVGPTVFDPTLRTQVVGSDAAALRDRVAQAYEDLRGRLQVAYGQPAGRLYAAVRGYRVDQFSDTDAWLRLLTEGPGADGPVLATSLLQLRWTDGDWSLVAPPEGTFASVVARAPSADSYTAFR